MRDRFLAAFRYILERLREPGTHVGLVVLLTGWVGIEARSVNAEQLAGLVALVSGSLLAALPSTKL